MCTVIPLTDLINVTPFGFSCLLCKKPCGGSRQAATSHLKNSHRNVIFEGEVSFFAQAESLQKAWNCEGYRAHMRFVTRTCQGFGCLCGFFATDHKNILRHCSRSKKCAPKDTFRATVHVTTCGRTVSIQHPSPIAATPLLPQAVAHISYLPTRSLTKKFATGDDVKGQLRPFLKEGEEVAEYYESLLVPFLTCVEMDLEPKVQGIFSTRVLNVKQKIA